MHLVCISSPSHLDSHDLSLETSGHSRALLTQRCTVDLADAAAGHRLSLDGVKYLLQLHTKRSL